MFYHKCNFSGQPLAAVFLFFIFLPLSIQAQSQSNLVNKQAKTSPVVDLVKRADRYKSEGKYVQAIADYKRALQLKPKDAEIYHNLGVVYAKQQRYPEALAALNQAIGINPKLAPTYFNLSVVYDHLNRPQEALAAARRALEIEPQNTLTITLICELELVLNQNEEAVECYESLEKLTLLDGRANTYYGMALFRAKKMKRAIPVLEEAIRLLPEKLVAYNLLGQALYEKERYKEAVDVLKQALRLAPENDRIRFNLAVVELTNRNKAAALAHYRILQDKNPALAQKLFQSIYSDKVVFAEDDLLN